MNKLIHDTTLYEDIPSPEGREEKEMAVYRLLSDLGIPYERMDHEAMDTMEACQGVDEILHIHMCKNLFLCNSQKTVFYLLLMPGEKKFKTKELSKGAEAEEPKPPNFNSSVAGSETLPLPVAKT